MLPDLEIADGDLDATAMLNRAIELAQTGEQSLARHPLLGGCPSPTRRPDGLADKLRRTVRQDAVDHHAEADAAAVLGPRRW